MWTPKKFGSEVIKDLWNNGLDYRRKFSYGLKPIFFR